MVKWSRLPSAQVKFESRRVGGQPGAQAQPGHQRVAADERPRPVHAQAHVAERDPRLMGVFGNRRLVQHLVTSMRVTFTNGISASNENRCQRQVAARRERERSGRPGNVREGGEVVADAVAAVEVEPRRGVGQTQAGPSTGGG